MTFTIDQIYKEGVPRKQPYAGVEHTMSNGSTAALTISPATTPAWCILIETVRITESSLATSGTGSGILNFEYPEYDGSTSTSFVASDLGLRAESVETVGSETYYTFRFKPPVFLKSSNDVSSLTIGLPTDVGIDSGTISYVANGWTLKEEDYD